MDWEEILQLAIHEWIITLPRPDIVQQKKYTAKMNRIACHCQSNLIHWL